MNFEKVAKIIADYRETDVANITRDTLLSEDLGLDSLDTVELMMTFEEELGITIELTNPVKTVGELADFIQEAAQDA